MATEYGGVGSLLLCSVVVGLFVTADIIRQIDDLWKHSWLGYSLLAFGYVAFLWFRFHTPPSGYAITAMAVAAAVMGLRPEMGGRERSLWFVLLILYALVEIRAINHDRWDQNDKFNNIANGLKTSIGQGTTAIQGLDTTIHEGREHFDKTMSGLKDAVNTETGGDAFCYLDFSQALNNVGGMTIVRVGKYPLRGVSAEIMDQARTQAMIEALLKNHHPPIADEVFEVQRNSEVVQPIPDFATPSRFIGGYQMTKGDRQSFQIVFRAFNGSWIERLEIREVKGKWSKAMMVEVPGRKPYLFFKIDPDYPRVDGKLDVPGWPRPVKGKPEWEH